MAQHERAHLGVLSNGLPCLCKTTALLQRPQCFRRGVKMIPVAPPATNSGRTRGALTIVPPQTDAARTYAHQVRGRRS
eukprot:5520119-Pyramimonas_sp.AAC.1